MKNIILILGLIFVTQISFAARTTERTSDLVVKALPLASGLVEGVFAQNLDHANPMSNQTFNQRYWFDSEYASGANAPVIYHICGEGACDEDYFLHDNAIEWAKKLGAHLVYLEHRYYGSSLPFADLATEHMQYLTFDNVIEDLATFQKWLTVKQNMTGKWIAVGGSYSGTLAAIYRLRHPELVVGALAASAPMISGTSTKRGSSIDVLQLSSTAPGDSRPWVYQTCSTFSFWYTNGTTIYGPSSWLCQQLFGNMTLADDAFWNKTYQYPFITNTADSVTNVFFTYGSADAWTKVGFSQNMNANPNVTIRLIKGAGHHFDLNAPKSNDSAEVKSARAQFLVLATQWLK